MQVRLPQRAHSIVNSSVGLPLLTFWIRALRLHKLHHWNYFILIQVLKFNVVYRVFLFWLELPLVTFFVGKSLTSMDWSSRGWDGKLSLLVSLRPLHQIYVANSLDTIFLINFVHYQIILLIYRFVLLYSLRSTELAINLI